MKQHNIPVVGRYLSEFVDDFKDHTEETISFYANELFELFSQYLMKSKYKFELNATSFGFELKKYDAISKVRKAKGISYVINLKELKQILIQKEYYEVLPEFIDEDENVPKKPKAREIKI
jgi:phage/plasmid-associated DNA primase